MQRYVLHSHKLYSIKIIHNFYQNLSWVPCCIYFLGVSSGKSRSRQHALNGRLWPWEAGLSYFRCVFLVTRPFTSYHNLWPSDLDLSYFTRVFVITGSFTPYHIFWPSDLELDLELWITLTKCCYSYLVASRRTLLHGCYGKLECWTRKPFNHTCWVVVITPTDSLKSVHNCCVIEIFNWRFCVVTLFFLFLLV